MSIKAEEIFTLFDELEENEKTEFFKRGFFTYFETKQEGDKQSVLELLKMDYEQTAERYQNIYQAIWQIFSYLSLVAGGILTFGNNVTDNIYLSIFLACTPLLFWYIAIFVPMNGYGYKAEGNLKDIESKIKEEFGLDLKHFTNFKARRTQWYHAFWRPNVRLAVLFFFFILCGIAGVSLFQAFLRPSPRLSLTDIKDANSIIRLIQQNPEQNKKTAFILKKLSPSAIEEIKKYNPEAPVSIESKRKIEAELNKIIETDRLDLDKSYNELDLVKKNEVNDLYSNVATTDDLLWANRKCLETFFPMALAEGTRHISDMIYLKFSLLRTWDISAILAALAFFTIVVFAGVAIRIICFEIYELAKSGTRPSINILEKYLTDEGDALRVITLRWKEDLQVLTNKQFMVLPTAIVGESLNKNNTKLISVEYENERIKPKLLTYNEIENNLTKKPDC